MECINCGGKYIEKNGALSFSDRIVGKYSVSDVFYYYCTKCSEYLFPPETIDKLECARLKRTSELVNSLPISEFITSSEAASLLGISRQAFHKHRHIRRGFIFHALIDGKKLFVRKSVLLFIEKGDGRYPLSQVSDECNLTKSYGKTITVYLNEEQNNSRWHAIYPQSLTKNPFVMKEGTYGKKYSR